MEVMEDFSLKVKNPPHGEIDAQGWEETLKQGQGGNDSRSKKFLPREQNSPKMNLFQGT